MHLEEIPEDLLDYFEPINFSTQRDIWNIATFPYSAAHFATYPQELVRRCVAAGTSEHGCCARCGKPWERVVEHQKAKARTTDKINADRNDAGFTQFIGAVTTTLGWRPGCSCNAPVAPCTVLDPFSGSGTSGLVALKLGRRYIGIELSPEYNKLALARIEGEAAQGKLF